jgi:hypothetical protein
MDVLTVLPLGSSRVTLRRAAEPDLPTIVGLLAADQLGATRDGVNTPEDLAAYQRAFRAIDADSAHLLVVADAGVVPQTPERVVATMQLSFLPGLARRGALRAQIEAVRVRDDFRGSGLGSAMFAWPSTRPGGATAPWSSSRPTSPGRPRTGSTSGSASSPRTRA